MRSWTSEWLRAARGGTGLSLLMVDIDHFKRFNDHYGHVAGDECLRQVAQLLHRCARRAGELVARYGGEEFVVLLPGAEVSQAEELAQRLPARCRSARVSPTPRHQPHAMSRSASASRKLSLMRRAIRPVWSTQRILRCTEPRRPDVRVPLLPRWPIGRSTRTRPARKPAHWSEGLCAHARRRY